MDKTPVNTNTIEEQLIEDILAITDPDFQGSGKPANFDRVRDLVVDFRTRFEDECFQAWNFAQKLRYDEDRSRYLDERRVLDAQQKSFRAVVGAYNREREKEGKTDHKFVDAALEAEGDSPSDPCQGHDHKDKPAGSQES